MSNEKIEFQEVRDFSGILNATFAFLKQNFRDLAICIILYVTPFILLSAILQGFSPMFMPNVNKSLANFCFFLLLTIIISSIYMAVVYALIYNYIFLYIEKGKNAFSYQEVWSLSSSHLIKIYFSTLLYILIVYGGLILLILPGIYWAISLSFIYAIMLYEGKSFRKAISRSFEILRGENNNFWSNFFKVFGLFIILTLIIYVLNYLILIPIELSSFGLENLMANSLGNFSIYIVGYSFLSTLINSLLFTILITSFAFQYFSLVEEKDAKNLFDRINTLGEGN